MTGRAGGETISVGAEKPAMEARRSRVLPGSRMDLNHAARRRRQIVPEFAAMQCDEQARRNDDPRHDPGWAHGLSHPPVVRMA